MSMDNSRIRTIGTGPRSPDDTPRDVINRHKRGAADLPVGYLMTAGAAGDVSISKKLPYGGARKVIVSFFEPAAGTTKCKVTKLYGDGSVPEMGDGIPAQAGDMVNARHPAAYEIGKTDNLNVTVNFAAAGDLWVYVEMAPAADDGGGGYLRAL